MKSYDIDMVFGYVPGPDGKVPSLSIFFHYLPSARDIDLSESRLQDWYPPTSPRYTLAEENPDYTPIELAGIEVLEYSGFGTVLRSGQRFPVSSFQYLWEQNDLIFSASVLGYNQSESRKIIESVIKKLS